MVSYLFVWVLAVAGKEVQAFPVVGQPTIVNRGGHVMNLSLLFQPLDEGQEKITLKAALVQIIRMPVAESSELSISSGCR